MTAVQAATIAIALSITALVAGCTSADSPGAAPQTASEPLSSIEPLFTLPLDEALALRAPHNAHRFDVLLDEALDRCVASKGVNYGQPERIAPASSWQHERRYGPMRIEEATRFGYRAPPSGVNSEELIEFQRSLPINVLEALYGPDDAGGGCLDEVGEAVALRSDPRWDDYAFVEELSNSTLSRALADHRLIETLEAWSRCVEDRIGMRFDHPADAIAHFSSDDGDLSTSEIDAAVADVECKHDTALIDVWAEVESELQLQLIDEHGDAIRAAESLSRELLEAAG